MGFSVLMSALLVLAPAAAPPSDPERCRAAVSEAQALLAAVEADPDSYENVEETRASLRRTIAEGRCAAPTPPEAERPAAVPVDDSPPRHEPEQARIRPVPGDSGRGPAPPQEPVPADRRKGVPVGVATIAAGVLLALGGLAWSIKGRAAAEGAWRKLVHSLALGAVILGIIGAAYGGYLVIGAISVTPGLALTGGGALAPAIAVDGAALAGGVAAAAVGARAASDGFSYSRSGGQPPPKAQAAKQYSVDDLSRRGRVLDRNGLTKAGRALQKHGDRPGSAYPKARWRELNAKGQEILDDILTSPGAKSDVRADGVLRVRTPDGRGASFNPDGSFRGFLEP